jgi:hypothetical protein
MAHNRMARDTVTAAALDNQQRAHKNNCSFIKITCAQAWFWRKNAQKTRECFQHDYFYFALKLILMGLTQMAGVKCF